RAVRADGSVLDAARPRRRLAGRTGAGPLSADAATPLAHLRIAARVPPPTRRGRVDREAQRLRRTTTIAAGHRAVAGVATHGLLGGTVRAAPVAVAADAAGGGVQAGLRVRRARAGGFVRRTRDQPLEPHALILAEAAPDPLPQHLGLRGR